MGSSAAMTSAQASNVMDASMATSSLSAIGGAVMGAQALKAQGQYASTIANTNASMANLKATQTLQAGDIEASRKALETQGAVGTARAQAGASGVDVNKGSPAMVQAGITTAGGIDVATIKNNAARAAWGYQTQAISQQAQGQFEQLTAEQKATQTLATGGIQALAGPLGLYSQAALWQYRYGMKGVPGAPYPGAGGTNTGGTVPTPTETDDSFWGTT